ncbi:MAG: hypothetical protein WD847_07620 [Pirellulales bacterium]
MTVEVMVGFADSSTLPLVGQVPEGLFSRQAVAAGIFLVNTSVVALGLWLSWQVIRRGNTLQKAVCLLPAVILVIWPGWMIIQIVSVGF